MNSLLDLQIYLTEKNLFNKYTWSGNIEHFKTFTTSEGVAKQRSFRTLPLDAKVWIDYVDSKDEFVLKVSYFTHEGVAVTKEHFDAEMDPKYPVTRYSEETTVRWKNNGMEYIFDMPKNAAIRIPSANIYLKM
jgi:hypothetical protein